ncbi:MAG: tetratricopeptide repeat protein, partial [Acidobacteriota bacterium]
MVLLLLTMSTAPPAWADFWYEHDARAETAIENGDWDRAIEELQQALERKGDSGARVRWYGMKVYPYFPYFKLGIAYYHLGQFEAALQAFQTEEQLGAIEASESDYAELRRYRNLALNARLEVARAEEERIAQIVGESLREAEILEKQGRLSAAMEALGRGLAVDPENSEAVAKMDELRTEVVRQNRERAAATRARDLVNRGMAELEKENYSEASSFFRQALEINPNPEAQNLFDRARDSLLAEIQAEEDDQARRQTIAFGLTQAGELVEAGRLAEALDRLQPVLAADPRNREAVALQQQVLERQQLSADRESLTRALADAQAEFTAGNYEAAISAANFALAFDPGNAEALNTVRGSYAQISRLLLGSRTVENLPPAIRFADFRTEQGDRKNVQLVSKPDFRLSGVVIDTSPVEVRFLGPEDREIQGSSTSQAMGEVYITEFALDDELVDGLSTYHLVATDNAGLSTNAEYTVIYTAPFYRTPWFQLVVVLIPVAALAGVWAHRASRRRQLMKRRFNPDIAGAPVLDR